MKLFSLWSMMARQWLDVMDEIMSLPLIMPIDWHYQPTFPDAPNWSE
jgi:hypothetical protein